MTQPPGAPELTQRHSGLRRCPKPQTQGGAGSEFLPGGRAQACLPFGWAALRLRWGPVLASVSCAAAPVASRNPADTGHVGAGTGTEPGPQSTGLKKEPPRPPANQSNHANVCWKEAKGKRSGYLNS